MARNRARRTSTCAFCGHEAMESQRPAATASATLLGKMLRYGLRLVVTGCRAHGAETTARCAKPTSVLLDLTDAIDGCSCRQPLERRAITHVLVPARSRQFPFRLRKGRSLRPSPVDTAEGGGCRLAGLTLMPALSLLTCRGQLRPRTFDVGGDDARLHVSGELAARSVGITGGR